MVIVVSYAVFGFYSKHGKPRERERLRERKRGREGERERERERKREREKEREREREREGETYTEQPETIRTMQQACTHVKHANNRARGMPAERCGRSINSSNSINTCPRPLDTSCSLDQTGSRSTNSSTNPSSAD